MLLSNGIVALAVIAQLRPGLMPVVFQVKVNVSVSFGDKLTVSVPILLPAVKL